MLGLHSNALYTSHSGQGDGRGLSPRIWGRQYGTHLAPDGYGHMFMHGDEFLNFGAIAPSAGGTTGGIYNGYGYYVDTTTAAASIQQLATAVGGVVRLATPAQDNYDANFTSGGNVGVLGVVSDTAGADKLMLFEARFRVGQVSNAHNFFIGLAEEGCAITDGVFTDAGALADKDMIGFFNLEAAGSTLKFGYKKAGQAAVTVLTYATALVADTWYKVGFVYDPAAPAANRIRVFINNEEQGTYVTAANIAAATFPDGEELAFVAALKNGSAAAKTADVDWWAFGQAG